MLITFYYLYLNIKNKMHQWFYNEPEPKIIVLQTIIEETEESESDSDAKYDYNKYA